MIVGGAVAIALSVIVDEVVDNLILGTGGGEGLSGVVDPRGIQRPGIVELIGGYDVDIVATVVVGIVSLALTDAVDASLRPRQCVAEPSRQPSGILASTEFSTVASAFACQDESLNLDS